eukprot:9049098-Ditylum_brightwellii.AAC.1
MPTLTVNNAVGKNTCYYIKFNKNVAFTVNSNNTGGFAIDITITDNDITFIVNNKWSWWTITIAIAIAEKIPFNVNIAITDTNITFTVNNNNADGLFLS